MRTRQEKKNIERWDFVDNSIFELIKNLNPTGRKIKWDTEIISRIRQDIQTYLVDNLKLTTERKFYP